MMVMASFLPRNTMYTNTMNYSIFVFLLFFFLAIYCTLYIKQSHFSSSCIFYFPLWEDIWSPQYIDFAIINVRLFCKLVGMVWLCFLLLYSVNENCSTMKQTSWSQWAFLRLSGCRRTYTLCQKLQAFPNFNLTSMLISSFFIL